MCVTLWVGAISCELKHLEWKQEEQRSYHWFKCQMDKDFSTSIYESRTWWIMEFCWSDGLPEIMRHMFSERPHLKTIRQREIDTDRHQYLPRAYTNVFMATNNYVCAHVCAYASHTLEVRSMNCKTVRWPEHVWNRSSTFIILLRKYTSHGVTSTINTCRGDIAPILCYGTWGNVKKKKMEKNELSWVNFTL